MGGVGGQDGPVRLVSVVVQHQRFADGGRGHGDAGVTVESALAHFVPLVCAWDERG